MGNNGRIDYEATLKARDGKPAFHIPISDDHLKMIGELCAIQGQIELMMQTTVSVLARKSMQAARKKMSGSLKASANYWFEVVEKHHSNKTVIELARLIVNELPIIMEGRNDFVHAVFASSGGEGFMLQRNLPGEALRETTNPAVAVHNLKTNPMTNLQEIRDKAAVISEFVYGIFEANGLPKDALPDHEVRIRKLFEKTGLKR